MLSAHYFCIILESDAKSPTVKPENHTLETSSSFPLVGAPAPPPPPVPPPPLPFLSSSVNFHSVVKPNKIPVKPRVKMRPLFWNRVVLERAENEGNCQ